MEVSRPGPSGLAACSLKLPGRRRGETSSEKSATEPRL